MNALTKVAYISNIYYHTYNTFDKVVLDVAPHLTSVYVCNTVNSKCRKIKGMRLKGKLPTAHNQLS
jgi:hypothetical protein